MSAENVTPEEKTSFLTRAMLLADRRKKSADAEEHPGFAADKKKFAVIAVAATTATVAAIALSWKALSKMAPVEEEVSDEETTSED